MRKLVMILPLLLAACASPTIDPYAVAGDDKSKPAGMWHGCPCGCGARSYLPFDDERFWKIEKPFPQATISPSIGMFAGQNPFHWHGFLRNGVFEEC